MLDSEVEETKDAADKEEVLTVTFHRNTEEAPEVTLKYFAYDDTYDSLEINGTERFLVKAEDVDALVKQIKKRFDGIESVICYRTQQRNIICGILIYIIKYFGARTNVFW